MGNFDMILERIGPFGRYQVLHYFLCSFAIIPSGTQNVLNVFLEAIPAHWCHVPELANLSVAVQENITAPRGQDSGTKPKDPSCRIRDTDYSVAYINYLNNETTSGFESYFNDETSGNESIPCTQWTYDFSVYGTTAVTKWDLVCTKASYPTYAQSIYMLGFLLGAFVFGFLSDRYGRKMALCVSLLGTVVFGCVSAFIPEFWGHVICRALAGFCVVGSLTVGFVMEMEIIGINKRMEPGLSAQIFFAIGYMILPLVAYFARSFVWTNFIMSVMPVVMLSYWWILPESPRWQMANGQVAKAKKELARAAKMNRAPVNIDELVEECISLDKKEVVQEDRSYTILDLFRTPNMRKRSLNMIFNWFVTSMVYYGLTMSTTDLAGSPYLNLFISGLCECAAMVVLMLTLDRFGRRLCLIVVLIIGGVSCTVGGLLPPEYAITKAVLSMIGKSGVAGSFGIIYVFTAELFPTVVRTIGVGAGSMSARVGGLLAPFVGQLNTIWRPLPTLIFGVLAVIAGLLSLFFPETLGQKLPESLEEGEQFGKNTRFCECYPCNRNRKSSANGTVDI